MKTRTQLKAIARDVLLDTINDLRAENVTDWPLRLSRAEQDMLLELVDTAKIDIRWSR